MRKLILLVDDKETIAKVASIYLGKDYDIQYFPDPIHALEWLHEGKTPDPLLEKNHYVIFLTYFIDKFACFSTVLNGIKCPFSYLRELFDSISMSPNINEKEISGSIYRSRYRGNQ